MQNEKYKKSDHKHRRHVRGLRRRFSVVHLWKEHFPLKKYAKIKPKVDGSLRVLQWISDNTYKIVLLDNYGSTTFNVSNISPHYGSS